MFTGDMTWRELRTFVRHLPRDSAYCRSVHGELVEWGVGEHLQAAAINDFRLANSGKRSLPESKLIRPPTAAAKPAVNGHRKPGTAADLDRLFTGG